MRRIRILLIFAAQNMWHCAFLYPEDNPFIMARPIKETPILIGKDARVFEEKINNPRIVTQAEIKAARESYDRLMSIAKFAF